MKPAYGRVSRYGLIAFASSLDQIGPMTRDVRDSALLLQAIAGHDPQDSTSANVEVPDYLAELERGVSGLRVGVVKELMGEGIETGPREVVERVARGLEGAGAEVGDVSLPHSRYGLPAYYIIAPAVLAEGHHPVHGDADAAVADGTRGTQLDRPEDAVAEVAIDVIAAERAE